MGRSKKKKGQREGKAKISQEEKNKLAITSDIEDGSTEVKQMQTLIDILGTQSCDEDLMYALATLSSFLLEEKGVKLLCQCNGLPVLVSYLMHTDTDIREKAVGSLRNFVITSNDRLLESLFNNGVIVKLIYIMKEAHKAIKENTLDLLPKEKLVKEYNFLAGSLELLSGLCEMSSVVVESLDLESLLPFLLLVITNEKLPLNLRVNAATCLYVISEENKTLAGLLLACYPNIFQEFVATQSNLLVTIVCNGIVYNMLNVIPEGKVDQVLTNILQSISTCLDVDAHTLVKTFKDEEEKETLLYVLQSQQIALELLSNIICYDDDESEEEAWEDDEEDDIVLTSAKSIKDETVSCKYMQVLHELNVPQKVLMKCIVSEENMKIEDQTIVKKLVKVQTRAWQCLSNVLSSPTCEIKDVEIQELWSNVLGTMCRETAGDTEQALNGELIDAFSSAMRAIASQLFARYSSPDMVCNVEFITLISKLFHRQLAESSQMNLVSIIGMIGKHVCNNKQHDVILQAIGELFSSLLSQMTSAVVIAELLDATFDTFADGPSVDLVLRETGLLLTLKNISNKMKTMSKEEKRMLADNVGIVNMAKTNLTRFIRYKENIS